MMGMRSMNTSLLVLTLTLVASCTTLPNDSLNVWTPFQRGIPTHATVLALASAPHDPQTIFAGAYGRIGVYISRDRARTWQTAHTGLDPAPVYTLQWIDHHLYAGTANGLYRWRETRWTRIESFPRVTVYALTRARDGTIYVATDARGIYATRDWHTWSRLPGLDNEILTSIVTLDTHTLLVGTSGNGAFITRDRGTTWRALEAFRGDYVTLVTTDPRTARVYLRTRRGLFCSDDAGVSWQRLHGGIENTIVNALVFDAYSARAYAGTTQGVFVTDNDGASWQNLAAFASPVLALIQLDAQTLVAGTQRGVYRSRDAGHTWESVNAGLGTPELHAIVQHPHTGTLFIGSEYGLYRATLDADTFERIGADVLNAPVLAVTLDPNDASTMYVGTYRRGIFISRDYGATWESAGGIFRGRLSPKGLLASSQGVFARVLFERIYKSDDHGETWRAVWTGMPYEAEVQTMSIAPSDPTQMYAGTNNGVYCSRDAGESWQWCGLENLTVFSIWIAPHNPQTLLVGATDGLYHSDDGGSTWTRGTLPYTVTALVRDDSGNFYAGTKYAGVWIRRHGSKTWQRLRGLDDASIIALHTDHIRHMLYAVTNQGLYRTRW